MRSNLPRTYCTVLFDNAYYFNPTHLKHKSVYSLLGIFGRYVEKKFIPFGTKYLSEAEPYLDQADSYNIRNGKKKNNLHGRLRRFVFSLQYSGVRQYFEQNQYIVAIAWNARSDIRYIFMTAARDAGAKTLYLELSPFPNAIAVDPNGINFLNSVPRCSSFYFAYEHEQGWEHLKNYISARVATKTDSEYAGIFDEPYIFVALQTEGDSQLVDFGGKYTTVRSYLEDICTASSQSANRRILVKEHPNSRNSLVNLTNDFPNVEIVNDMDTVELIQNADIVFTVNSSVGLESLILGTPVACSGQAFWDVEQLCYRAKNLDQLTSVMRQDSFEVNLELRNKFLSYLHNEYVIKLNWQADGVCRLPNTEISKVWKMLQD